MVLGVFMIVCVPSHIDIQWILCIHVPLVVEALQHGVVHHCPLTFDS